MLPPCQSDSIVNPAERLEPRFSDYLRLERLPLPGLPAPVIVKTATFNGDHFHDSYFQRENIHLPPAIQRAVANRRREYFAGRYLAKLALADAGIGDFNLTADERRCPVWPEGFRGSISHSGDFAICLLARTRDLRALGVDVVDWLDDAVAERLTRKIVDRDERQLLTECGLPFHRAISLCFSAKESIYKGLYPHVRAYFGFGKAKLRAVDVDARTLTFDLDTTLRLPPLEDLPIQLHYHEFASRGITVLASAADNGADS